MTTTRDRVQVLKGRRLLSQKVSDTLGVKLAGGPTLSIYVDIVKNQDALLDMETLNYYDFFMEEPKKTEIVRVIKSVYSERKFSKTEPCA